MLDPLEVTQTAVAWTFCQYVWSSCGVATSDTQEGVELWAYKISTRYINQRPRYYYFRFLKTKCHHIEILLPVLILTYSLSSAYDSALAYQILCKLDIRRQSYDVIQILQDDSHSVANLLQVSSLAMSNIQEGLKLSAHQILTRYLNPQSRYYYRYFRFLKKGPHIEMLLPVSILTLSLSLACDSALAYQILRKLEDRRRSYDVILILQDGHHSVANLLPVSSLATFDILEGLKLSSYQFQQSSSVHGPDINTSGF